VKTSLSPAVIFIGSGITLYFIIFPPAKNSPYPLYNKMQMITRAAIKYSEALTTKIKIKKRIENYPP
jgi:hypothetical protein